MRNDEKRRVTPAHTFNRRHVLGLMGAGAISLMQGACGRDAVGEPTSFAAPRARGVHASIAADPATIAIDLAQTAVLVIDMQHDFASKGGMLDRLGADIAPIQRAVPPTARVLAAARNVGMPVIYLKMAFKPDLSDLGPPNSPNWIAHQHAGVGARIRTAHGREGRILIQDTWNTEVVEDLRPEPADSQIYKHRYSGFFETELDATLKRSRIRSLIVTGCTTSVCVESTIRDAMFRDYSAILLADCSGEPLGNDLPRSNHQASLFVIADRNFGWVSSSGEFLKSLEHMTAS